MNDEILEKAKHFLNTEADAITYSATKLDQSFTDAVELVFNCQGKIVVTGMGKSGNIGQKFSSMLASTGTPSIFLNTAEAFHGDLGIIQDKDVIIAIAYSGETPELLALFPCFKRRGLPVVLITGRAQSTLAAQSDVVVDIHVNNEACPIQLSPTTSAIVTLAICDAIGAVIMDKRRFTPEDYAQLHPGGSLGRQLLTRVRDLMHSPIPRCSHDTPMSEIILTMSGHGFGITAVFDHEEKLIGIISDGDLRRAFKAGSKAMTLLASTIMTENPKTIWQDELAAKAVNEMEKYKITALFVRRNKEASEIIGLIHMHDLLQNKIV